MSKIPVFPTKLVKVADVKPGQWVWHYGRFVRAEFIDRPQVRWDDVGTLKGFWRRMHYSDIDQCSTLIHRFGLSFLRAGNMVITPDFINVEDFCK